MLSDRIIDPCYTPLNKKTVVASCSDEWSEIIVLYIIICSFSTTIIYNLFISLNIFEIYPFRGYHIILRSIRLVDYKISMILTAHKLLFRNVILHPHTHVFQTNEHRPTPENSKTKTIRYYNHQNPKTSFEN